MDLHAYKGPVVDSVTAGRAVWALIYALVDADLPRMKAIATTLVPFLLKAEREAREGGEALLVLDPYRADEAPLDDVVFEYNFQSWSGFSDDAPPSEVRVAETIFDLVQRSLKYLADVRRERSVKRVLSAVSMERPRQARWVFEEEEATSSSPEITRQVVARQEPTERSSAFLERRNG